MIRRFTVLFLLIFVLPAAPAGAGDDEIDILKISPDDLVGASGEDLVRQGGAAYARGEFEDAARFYIRALRVTPADTTALYNLACCYGLLGMPEQAARFLEAAWKAGFTDLAHIEFDPDFELVREEAVFEKTMVRLREAHAKKVKEAGKRLLVESRVVADVRVIAPEGVTSWGRYPLVVGLHGYGDNGENFAALFARREIEAPFIYCVPEAPYAFSGGSRVAMSWGFGGPGVPLAAELRSALLAEEYILEVVRAVKREYPVDEQKVFVLGFSQGASMAFRMGLRHSDVFSAAIPVGGWLVPGEFTPAQMARARKESLIFVCHSPEDRMVTFDACERAIEFLDQAGIRHSLLRYEGGHSLPVNLLKRIVSWLDAPQAGGDDAITLPSADGLLLRYRFAEGETRRYRTSTRLVMESEQVRIRQEQEDLAAWTAKSTKEGTAEVDITYEEVSCSLDTPTTGPVTYSSKSPPDPDVAQHLAVVMASALVDRTVRLVLTSRGKVEEFSGYAAIYEELAKKDSRVRQLGRKFDDRVRARSMQAFLSIWPEHPVAVGDTWTESYRMTLPTLGECEMEVHYTFEEVQTNGDRRLARITTRSELPRTSVEGRSLLGGATAGEILFDLERGVTVRVKTRAEAQIEMAGTTFDVESHTESKLVN